MAYKEHGMWEVLDVLRRIHRGESLKAIVRVTGRGRGTVRRYVKGARALGWVPGSAVPTEELASEVLARLRPWRESCYASDVTGPTVRFTSNPRVSV